MSSYKAVIKKAWGDKSDVLDKILVETNSRVSDFLYTVIPLVISKFNMIDPEIVLSDQHIGILPPEAAPALEDSEEEIEDIVNGNYSFYARERNKVYQEVIDIIKLRKVPDDKCGVCEKMKRIDIRYNCQHRLCVECFYASCDVCQQCVAEGV